MQEGFLTIERIHCVEICSDFSVDFQSYMKLRERENELASKGRAVLFYFYVYYTLLFGFGRSNDETYGKGLN